jgi:23S rRNA (adenine2030-N6)-methyltransferase
MNYQHAFHAGNFADVHKHVVLTLLLDHLRTKPAAFRVIDSHAGSGRYDLFGAEAARSPEWRDGIARLVAAAPELRQSAPFALVKPYFDIVAAQNASGALRVYPGSPLIAKALLRPQDRLIACEREPRAAASLKTALRGDPRVKVLAIDGWIAIKANVPPKERRGLVLIDPPYEEADDFVRLSSTLGEAHRKWPTGTYMLWYPIKERDAPEALARQLRRLGVPKVLRSEMTLRAPHADAGLAGSGLIVVNPPHTLERDLEIVLPVLIRVLSPSATQRLDWLVGEQQRSARGQLAKR